MKNTVIGIVDLYEKLSTIQSIKLVTNVSGKDYEFSFVALDPSGVFLVMEEGDIRGREKEIADKVFPFQNLLSLSAHKTFIYSFGDSEWFFLNQYTDEAEQIDDVYGHIMTQVNSGTYFIDENRLDYLYNKLSFSVSGSENIREMPDGSMYVRKGGHWFPASDEDSDYAFKQTCLFGWLGWFQNSRGKKGSAVFYALTFGLFGIGWIFDALAFLVGAARDADGYYYLPLSDKKKAWLMFLGVICGAFLGLYVYRYVLMFLTGLLANIISSVTNPSDLESAVSELAG